MAADRQDAVTEGSMSIAGRLTTLEQASHRAAMRPEQPDRPDVIAELLAAMTVEERAEFDEALALDRADWARGVKPSDDRGRRAVELLEQKYMSLTESEGWDWLTKRS